MISSYETIPVKTLCEETPDGPGGGGGGGGTEYPPRGGGGGGSVYHNPDWKIVIMPPNEVNPTSIPLIKQMLIWAEIAEHRGELHLAYTLRKAADEIERPIKIVERPNPDEVNPLRPLAELGRWCLNQSAQIEQFSPGVINAIEATAVDLGLGYMEDMGTYNVFIESDKAKALDVDA